MGSWAPVGFGKMCPGIKKGVQSGFMPKPKSKSSIKFQKEVTRSHAISALQNESMPGDTIWVYVIFLYKHKKVFFV